MKTWIERNYGADADGNRGITYREYELEPSDFEEVQRKVLAQLLDYADDIPEKLTITMPCPVTDDDIKFDVYVKDYI